MQGKWIEVDADGVGWNVECYRSGEHTVYEHEQTNRMQIPIVIENFCCPVCDSKEFGSLYEEPEQHHLTMDTVIGPGPMAGMPRVDHKCIVGYRCPGCSTRYDDPARFSKNKPAKIVPPIATPNPTEQYRADQLQRKIDRGGGRDLDPSHRIRSTLIESMTSTREFSPGCDNFCALCGAEDLGDNGWGKLADPCPASNEARLAYDETKGHEVTTFR